MGKIFLKKFLPQLCTFRMIGVMGMILRYVCWGTHRPPPPLWGIK